MRFRKADTKLFSMKSRTFTSFIIHTSLLVIVASCRSSMPSKLAPKSQFECVNDSTTKRDSIEVVNIKKYKIYIDSLIKYDQYYEYIMSGIEEGKIKRETRRVKTNTFTDDLDTTIKIKNGGFGKYTYGNRKGDNPLQNLLSRVTLKKTITSISTSETIN